MAKFRSRGKVENIYRMSCNWVFYPAKSLLFKLIHLWWNSNWNYYETSSRSESKNTFFRQHALCTIDKRKLIHNELRKGSNQPVMKLWEQSLHNCTQKSDSSRNVLWILRINTPPNFDFRGIFRLVRSFCYPTQKMTGEIYSFKWSI